ncbi:MAG: L,D-transpeptidase [Candidatus Magasanikbacteria bacterium]|nr:L,D-transpeptidase [Candidatus Magasanikbacteria bacterium]
MRHLLIPVLLFLFLVTTFALRREIYSVYEHVAYLAGANPNEIATDSYVDSIKSQNSTYQPNAAAVFLNKSVTYASSPTELASVLGENSTASGEKYIEVSLKEQRLYMKQGSTTVNSFLISSGKWSPTPKGEWRIWTKLRYTRMRGGSKSLGTFYDLPNVPYTMYYDRGYGIHGAYWHNNFRHPMSHGCINMRPSEAGVVFNWASVGTRVIIHD